MRTIDTEDPIAVAVVEAIQLGDLTALERLLAAHAELATARLGDDDPDGMSRTLLHVATDFPGHFPNGAATVAALAAAGADVHGRFPSPHEETPLHWAASTDECRGARRVAGRRRRAVAAELVGWLRGRGGRSAGELRR